MTSLFETALRLSIAGGLICLVILGLGILLRNRLPKAWLYCLWLLAVLRFIVPVSFSLPHSPQLVLFPAQVSAETSSGLEPEGGGFQVYEPASAQAGAPHITQENQAIPPQAGPPAAVYFDAPRLMSTLWLAGSGGMFLWYAIGYGLTIRKLKRNRVLLGMDNAPIYESPLISTPILAGILRPAVYLPKDFAGAPLAIRHELCHLRRGDIWLKWLVQLVVCLHWFNPLVYLMKRETNRLSELACDEAVVRGMDDEGRRAYGYMLLETLRSSSSFGGLMIAALGKNKRWLKERMHGIMEKHTVNKKVIIAMVLVVVCVMCTALLAGCALTNNAASDNNAPTDKSIAAQTPIEPANGVSSKTALKTADMPFINDPDVLGTWDKVAAVKNIDDFDPSQVSTPDPDPMYLVFCENGATNFPVWTWTKNVVSFNHVNQARSYEIKEIDGSKYLFFNTAFNESTMNYTVFKWTSDSTTPVRLVDDIDPPFVDDPAVIGTWKYVDYVRDISDFDPAAPKWPHTSYLKEMTFLKDGDFMSAVENSESRLVPYVTWTNGVILHQGAKTASHYEIKEINGTTYIFFEWKSGDYVFLHMKPSYYVLEKAD